jgi:hypothetical protein
MSDTTANSSAPDAAAMAAGTAKGEYGLLLDSIRRRRGTELAGAAMASQGDLTKVEGYGNLSRCLTQLRAIEQGHGGGSMGEGLRAASDASAALLRHRDAFRKAFGPSGSEAGKYIYTGAVMALYCTVTLLCTQAVSYHPQGASGNLMPAVDSQGAGKVAGMMVVSRLRRFADAADKHAFDTAVAGLGAAERASLEETVWGQTKAAAAAIFKGGVSAGGPAAVAAGLGVPAWGVGAAVGLGLVFACLYLARDVTAWVYEVRSSMAGWLGAQAAFLDANAATLDPSKAVPRAKQEGYARRLRAIADRIKVDASEAERGAAGVIRGDDRAMDPAYPGTATALV